VDDKFCKMPFLILERKDLLPATKLVWAILNDRIGNNGTTWPSVNRLAKDVGVSRDTVIRSIKQLSQKGLISVDKTFGTSNSYQLQNATGSKLQLVANCDGGSSKMQLGPVAKCDSNQTKITRPNNQTKRKSEVSLPAKLTSIGGFEVAWDEWLTYRRERKLTVTPTCLKKQLAMLEKQPDPIAVINKSVESGWQGLFPIKGDSNQGKSDGEIDWSAEYHRVMGPMRNLTDEEFKQIMAEGN
jgi:hypothetical protein